MSVKVYLALLSCLLVFTNGFEWKPSELLSCYSENYEDIKHDKELSKCRKVVEDVTKELRFRIEIEEREWCKKAEKAYYCSRQLSAKCEEKAKERYDSTCKITADDAFLFLEIVLGYVGVAVAVVVLVVGLKYMVDKRKGRHEDLQSIVT